jgi:hypothetical protein
LNLPFDTPTAWKNKDKHYSIGTLAVLAKGLDKKPAELDKECRSLKVPIVAFMDNRNLTKYFKNEVEASNFIDSSIWSGTLLNKPGADRKRDAKAIRKENENLDSRLPKKNLDVMHYVNTSEKRIHSRATILQSKKRSFLKVL